MTKAKSVAQRRKSRGRPKLEGIREPNGRLSRTGIVHEPADIIALAARRRHTGLPERHLKDQKAATFIGRMNLMGELSNEQYDAAQTFIALNNEMRKTLQSPGAYYEATGGATSAVTPEYVKWVQRTRERFSAASYAIFEAQRENRTDNLVLVLDKCVLEDVPMPDLIGAVRLACNVLDRHFSLDSAKR